MWAKNKYAVLFILLFILVIGWIVFNYQTTPKTGFIVIQEVYNGFSMKKEMEQKYNQAKMARATILDSLELGLKILARKIEGEQLKNKSTIEQFNIQRETFLERKQTYEEDNAALTKQYDQEILTQLNQYLKDFGEEHHFTYLFGNDGNGSLVYAADAKNVTKEVIAFINRKYKGIE